MAIEIGDQVKLKSGGPAMTVSGFTDPGLRLVQCVWFSDHRAAPHSFDFHEDALEPA